MTAFKVGDRVVPVKGQMLGEVYNMISGKVGVVVNTKAQDWDYLVRIEGTQRTAPYFGFNEGQIAKASE